MSGSALAVAWPADDFQAPESAPPRPWWTPISRANLRGAALQWATGLFCAFIGARMLVVPHQFGAQAYDTLRPNMLVWGTATLLAGMAMIVVAVALIGAMMLAFPEQFVAPAFDAIRASFVWYGISFLLCGLLVTTTQLALRVPLWARWLAMLLLVPDALVAGDRRGDRPPDHADAGLAGRLTDQTGPTAAPSPGDRPDRAGQADRLPLQ